MYYDNYRHMTEMDVKRLWRDRQDAEESVQNLRMTASGQTGYQQTKK